MHAYLPLHVSAQFTYLFTFECIFHVVGQFGENCFFKEQSEMFLQIRDWHDALQCFSVHIIYLTLPVYFIPTKQSTSIKYNLYTNRKFTHTKIRKPRQFYWKVAYLLNICQKHKHKQPAPKCCTRAQVSHFLI